MELQIIQNKIHEVRGVRVMLDKDLAELYGVETKALNRAVKRNIERFPERFMFQLTKEEALRCQFGTLNDMPLERGKHMKYLPYAFTEQGVSMLSAVLRSPTAIQVSISIMDAFVTMRNCILTRTAESVEIARLRERVLELEQATEEILGGVNDLSEDVRKDIETIYEAIGALSVELPKRNAARRPIGFRATPEKEQ